MNISKTIIALIILVSASSASFAQLKSDATMLKKEMPKSYDAIRTFAVAEWGSDHNMVVYEINKQAKAMIDMLSTPNKNDSIFLEAYTKWTEKNVSTLRISENPTTNWNMVLYEYKKQTKASSSY